MRHKILANSYRLVLFGERSNYVLKGGIRYTIVTVHVLDVSLILLGRTLLHCWIRFCLSQSVLYNAFQL